MILISMYKLQKAVIFYYVVMFMRYLAQCFSKILVSAKLLANKRKPLDKFWRALLNKRLHQP